MFCNIEERIIAEAEYMIENSATVRKTAKVFGVSKSTVHKDVSQKLKNIDKRLYKRVKAVLILNLGERHLRGGIATKNKYLSLRSK